jgi:hypothetical protein
MEFIEHLLISEHTQETSIFEDIENAHLQSVSGSSSPLILRPKAGAI